MIVSDLNRLCLFKLFIDNISFIQEFKSFENLDNSDDEDDLEIPAFLRRQKKVFVI